MKNDNLRKIKKPGVMDAFSYALQGIFTFSVNT
jgi:hypothetical protein